MTDVTINRRSASAQTKRRRVGAPWRFLAALLAVCVALAAGWGLARRFESPDQRQARALPPPAKELWYPVKQGKLVDQTSGRGTVEPGSVVNLSLPGIGALAVITRSTAAAGQDVHDGEVVAEVNGAPVFLFSGAFPFYRDFGAGATGPDVKQLQDGLSRAGLSTSAGEYGLYGPSTQRAVQELFRRNGYEPAPTLSLTNLLVTRALPARLVKVSGLGDQVTPDQPIVSLGQGALVATVQLDAGAVSRIRKGMDAQIFAHGRLIAHANVTNLPKSEEESVVEVTPSRPLASNLSGRHIVVVVNIDVIAQDAWLVPARALVPDGMNTGSILLKAPGGVVSRVRVKRLGELAGVAAVEAEDGVELSADDSVKVG